MIPMTPSGTLTREIFRPFGLPHSASVRPTGSGSAAMSSSPFATASSRFGSSASRSSKAEPMPLFRAAVRSSALAARISLALLRTAAAASRSASSRAFAETRDSAGAASRARRPIAAIVAARSPLAVSSRTRVSVIIGKESSPARHHQIHHQIVAVNDFVAATVAENRLDFIALVPGDQTDIGAGIGRQPASDLVPGMAAHDQAIAALEA